MGALTDTELERLRAVIRGLGSVAVALSGGVDSSLVAKVAHDVLGDRAVAVTGVSPSLAPSDLDDAGRVSAAVGIRLVRLATAEMDDPRYVRNAPDRCYFCKSELYDRVAAWAAANGFEHVVDGLNADDDVGDRPGVVAGDERGVRSPLREAGISKARVRSLARLLGLPTAGKPAAPCLASRIPHGTPVTAGRLREVGNAERRIRGLGFPELRVRHHGAVARVEVPEADLPRLIEARVRVTEAIRAAGFERLDLEGLHVGSAR